jgi:hypothetical protein
LPATLRKVYNTDSQCKDLGVSLEGNQLYYSLALGELE